MQLNEKNISIYLCQIQHSNTHSLAFQHSILHSEPWNPYLHLQTLVQLQGHQCQSISLVFHMLSLPLSLFTQSQTVCVYWRWLVTVSTKHLIHSEHPSPFDTHTHTHFHPILWLTDLVCTVHRFWDTLVKKHGLAFFVSCPIISHPPPVFLSVSALSLDGVCFPWVCERSPRAAPSLSLKCYLVIQLDAGNSRWALSSIQSMTLILPNQPIKILLSATKSCTCTCTGVHNHNRTTRNETQSYSLQGISIKLQ